MVPPGKYLVRIRWFNKMNGRQFDEWQIRTWDGSRWNLFSGCEVVDWRALIAPFSYLLPT